MKLSVVVPVYGCPGAVVPLCQRLKAVLAKITKEYEIILVNDGCPKNSWKEIEKVCADDKKIVGINLSRNFGQVNATNAGIEYSTGEYVVLLDCDLQDPPEAILQIYEKIFTDRASPSGGSAPRGPYKWLRPRHICADGA